MSHSTATSHSEFRTAWLSLLGNQDLGRPVKLEMDEKQLAVYGNSRALALTVGHSGLNTSSDGLGAPASSISVNHKSVAVPHPQFHLKPVTSEAVAHHMLFSEANDLPPMDAVVLSCPVPEVANYISLYIELLIAKGLDGALPADQDAWFALVSSRSSEYCVAVINFTGICLNSQALTALLKMVSTLGSVDVQQAERLKHWIAKAQSEAQAKVKPALPASPASPASTGSSVGPPSLSGIGGKANTKFGTKFSQDSDSARLFVEPGFAEEFASQIAYFHRSVWNRWNPLNDASLAFQTPACSSMFRMNPLVFDFDSNPHFLQIIFSQHIFNPNLKTSQRARVLETWIVVAHELYTLGDFVGWSAVILCLYSVACLRLAPAWYLVDQKYIRQYARDWEFECFEITKRARLPFLAKNTFRHTEVHVGADYGKKEFTPYLVDMLVRDSNGAGDMDLTVKQLQRLAAISSSWQSYLAQLPDEEHSTRASQIQPDDVFQRTFYDMAQQTRAPLDLMKLSLRTQPKFMGYYLPYFYHQNLPLTSGAMLPVLFTPSVPIFRLFPRSTLLMATLPKQPHKPQPLRRSSSFPSAARPEITGVTELDSGARDQLENTASAHVLASVVRDLLNVGTDTVDTRTGIIFKCFEEQKSRSYRSSRTSSIIETFNRRASYRPNSGRAPSAHSQQHLDVPSQKTVFVKSSSLVRLVDVLVLGAGVFSPGSTLDTDSHTETLLATYRSFCSPAELIDMLKVRIRFCRGAAKTLAGVPQFPLSSWDIDHLWQTEDPNYPVNHWAITILGNIVNLLTVWINDYFFDFTDDKSVLDAGISLVSSLAEKVKVVEGYPTELVSGVARINGSFWRHLYSRPSIPQCRTNILKRTREAAVKGAKGPKSVIAELPSTSLEHDEGLQEINDMIDELDSIVADSFSQITLPDWMKLFEVLEVQTSKRTGLFMYNPHTPTTESETIVQDVYSWISTLHSTEEPGVRVLEQLPESISLMVRLHNSLVVYFASQVCDPTLAHAHERRERMVTLLKMLGILRSRMRFLNMSADIDPQHQDEQHIPSFLESALVSAILLPESRAYANSWLAAGQEVAKSFPASDGNPIGKMNGRESTRHHHHHSSGGDIVPNMRSIFIPSVPPTSGKPVTLCSGWIIERFLEIVGCVPSVSIENHTLINFDKRRYAYNLVKNMSGDFQDQINNQTSEDTFNKYAFLFEKFTDNRNAAVPSVLLDRKVLKESVGREGKVRHRIFTDIVSQEMEKSKAELKQHDRLERASSGNSSSHGLSSRSFYGLSASQSSTSLSMRRSSKLLGSNSTSDVSSILESGSGDAGTNMPNPSLPPNSSAASRRGSQNHKKSRLGGFFRSVRPLSVLGGYSNSSHGASASTGSQISSPQPSSSGSLYRHPQGSNTSVSEDSLHYGSPPQHSHMDSHNQLQHLQQLHKHQKQNSQHSTAQSASSWTEDITIDLDSLPSFSEFSDDDWSVIYRTDILGVIPAQGKSSSVIQLTFKQGKETEVVSLRAANATFAHSWLREIANTKKHLLMETTQVFGIPLDVVCNKENCDVPAHLETLLSRIEEVGLTEVGIYRISGSLGAVNSMKQWFDSGHSEFKEDDPKWNDINAVAGCIKLYLRELPESLMTNELLPEFFNAISSNSVDVGMVHFALSRLPRCNYYTLRRIIRHLRLIVDNSDENKMNVQNICIVFGVNFLPPVEIKQMGIMQNLVKVLVEEYDQLFAA